MTGGHHCRRAGGSPWSLARWLWRRGGRPRGQDLRHEPQHRDLPAPRGADDRHAEGQHVEGFHWRFGPVATSFQGGTDIRVPGAGGRRRNHLFSRL